MSAKRATSIEELEPLIEHCKAGRLFAVQDWIAEGKPILLPPDPSRRSRKRSPLEWAVKLGFHSLLEVFLKAGAGGESDDDFCLMCMVLQERRLDMLELLVEHGFNAKSVSMFDVFQTWDPEIMEFFIDRGADVETDNPLAWALCHRIRTALRILKSYRERFPSFQEQADIALRYHCRKGDLKWVSLMLWADADPFSPGEDEYDTSYCEEEGGITAVENAALWGHYEVFALKKIKLSANQPVAQKVLRYCCHGRGFELAQRLLSQGLNPNDQDNGGCSAIQSIISGLRCYGESYSWKWRQSDKNFDTVGSRDQFKMLHLCALHGGRWVPRDRTAINDARRSLLKMDPQYTAEFVWIMEKYRSCAKTDIETLLKTPTIKRHIREFQNRINEILRSWDESESTEANLREQSTSR